MDLSVRFIRVLFYQVIYVCASIAAGILPLEFIPKRKGNKSSIQQKISRGQNRYDRCYASGTGTSRKVNEARRTHTCSRPCTFGKIERNNNTKSRRTQTPPDLKCIFLVLETPYGHSRLKQHKWVICPTCRVRHPQSSHVLPRRDQGGQNICLDITLAGVCRSALTREQWRLVLSKIEKL